MNRRTFLSGAAAASALLPFAGALRSLASALPGSTQASIWIYLWDLADAGYDAPLQALKQAGLTSISLATAYHAGKFLSPHNPRRKVVFLEDGTVYFQPRRELYGKITPLVNSLVAEGHSLESARASAEKHGLSTRSWVVCCHNTPIGSAHPEVTTRTALGDRLLHNLCPSNPEVRAYLRALVRDLSTRGVEVIELEAMQFQGYSHGFHHEREGIPLPGLVRFMLGFCFCDACARHAKEARVDLEGFRAHVEETLTDYFADPRPEEPRFLSMETLPQQIFPAIQRWRRSVITSLAAELMEAAGAQGPRLRPLVSVDQSARILGAVDPAGIAGVTGGILVPGYIKDGMTLRAMLAPMLLMLSKAETTIGLQVGLPESGSKADFLGRMKACRELGITSFNFYNYGFIPLSHLAWIGEALG
jgi:hypothetical protein